MFFGQFVLFILLIWVIGLYLFLLSHNLIAIILLFNLVLPNILNTGRVFFYLCWFFIFANHSWRWFWNRVLIFISFWRSGNRTLVRRPLNWSFHSSRLDYFLLGWIFHNESFWLVDLLIQCLVVLLKQRLVLLFIDWVVLRWVVLMIKKRTLILLVLIWLIYCIWT